MASDSYSPIPVSGWWSSLSIVSPELALVTQTQDFSFAVFDLTSFPVSTWTDSGSGASVLATQSSMDAQPVLTNSAWGQPGLLFGPTTSMQAPAIWPTSAAYSVEVLLILYETDTAIVLGTSTHSLSIVDGWFILSTTANAGLISVHTQSTTANSLVRRVTLLPLSATPSC